MTRPLRLIHVADCHLDAPSRSLEAGVRQHVEDGARSALEGAVSLAIEREADALLIAGDLFDRDTVRLATELWLPETLAAALAAGVAVVIVSGNHDPGGGAGPLDRIRFPAGLDLVRSRAPRAIELRRRDGSVVGTVIAAGHEDARERSSLVATFPGAIAFSSPVVGLVHAQVHGYEGSHDRYAPCTTDELAIPGYAYWALGHVHARQAVRASPAAWYAGCLQGRDFGETGAKGALEVEVEPDGTSTVAFHPLAPVRWEDLRLDDLEQVSDARDLAEHVGRRFERLLRGTDVIAGQSWVLRLSVSGRSPLATELRGGDAHDGIARALRDRLGVLDVQLRDAGLGPPIDLADHAGRPHVLGEALALIDAAGRDDELLLALAPDRLAGAPSEPEARVAYLREILAGLDVELAARMLAGVGQ